MWDNKKISDFFNNHGNGTIRREGNHFFFCPRAFREGGERGGVPPGTSQWEEVGVPVSSIEISHNSMIDKKKVNMRLQKKKKKCEQKKNFHCQKNVLTYGPMDLLAYKISDQRSVIRDQTLPSPLSLSRVPCLFFPHQKVLHQPLVPNIEFDHPQQGHAVQLEQGEHLPALAISLQKILNLFFF